MATRPQADQLAVHYRQRLDEAHGLLSDGNAPVALDKCLEIRLKSDLVSRTIFFSRSGNWSEIMSPTSS